MGTVNWNEPIEAVHTDGQVASAFMTGRTCFPRYDVRSPEIGVWIVEPNGAIGGTQWSIRNVRTTRTSDEALRRMEALVRRCHALTDPDAEYAYFIGHANGEEERQLAVECASIVALLEPVDPRFAAVLAAITQQGVSEPVARLAARDVLKVLDK